LSLQIAIGVVSSSAASGPARGWLFVSERLVETLNNQPVGHFALNALDWRLLGELEQGCDLTISPAVREAVAQVASAAERKVIPLYEVRPQMRLGYLTDLDSILCTRSDPECGFQEGERYSLRTDSRINVTHGEKVTRNKQGEPVVRKYEEEAKVPRHHDRRQGVLRVHRGHPVPP
jgi:hypothetical protein